MSGATEEYGFRGASMGAIFIGFAGCASCLNHLPPAGSLRFQAFNLITGLVIGAVVGGLGGVAYGSVIDENESHAARAREEAELARRRQAAEAAEQQRREAEKARLLSLAAEAPGLLRSLAKTLADADSALTRAQNEFTGGYLDPFWNAIEEAVTQLAFFDTIVRQLQSGAALFAHQAASLGISTGFPVAASSVPDARPTTERLDQVVRRAQREVSFTQIYHLRKTNQILVSGFSTLAVAINDLGNRLEDSLGRLADTVSMELDRMVATQHQVVEHLKTRGQHDEEHRQILDNIQRRKLPGGTSQDDRDY